ncbi:MAG TPA: TnsA endonuclease N-terminal domain-containing protein [Azospirillum sp.]|nr:TnsA endonuclease N-terminal domain-containing protein [Azospirillum sp.]
MARRRYSFDEAKIARYHKEGRGKGHGAEYVPWIKVGDVPSRGRSHRLNGVKTGRLHHLLSDNEANLFRLLDWCDDVTDIREQFPLDREATRRIAEQLGIRHPHDTVTQTPLVMTTDVLVDVVRDGRKVTLARTVKPHDELDN